MANLDEDLERLDRAAAAAESEANAALSAMNPILYGALLSYAVYCVAEVVATVETQDATSTLSWSGAENRLAIAVAMLLFLIKDTGEVLKIDRLAPCRRATRYTLELWVVLSYAVSFGLIRVGSYLSLAAYGLALGLGGLWANSFKNEMAAGDDRLRLRTFGKSLRGLHYLGSLICGAQVFIASRHGQIHVLSPLRACIFALSLVLWMLTYEFELAYRCGPAVRLYTINFVFSWRWIEQQHQCMRHRAEVARSQRTGNYIQIDDSK